MEQQQLRMLEDKCIQECAPTCSAACPIHVDVRSMAAEMARGNFSAALKVLRKAVPFPGIISRVCDQPCRLVCKRSEAGEAIAIADLERACATFGEREKVSILPRRSKRVAIIGGGLSGLTVAYDLRRKGYGAVVFEMNDRLGGSLWSIPADLLPPDIIIKDLSILDSMGIEARLNTKITQIEPGDENSPLKISGEAFDAVYLGTGFAHQEVFDLQSDSLQQIIVHPISYTTSREGIFAGGGIIGRSPVSTGSPPVQLERSPVLAISDGRRAATSIDRYFQRVSLTASRLTEGPYTTRLFTNMEGIEPQPLTPIANTTTAYDQQETIQEAKRCIQCQCMECVKACEYLQQFGSHPKRYLREIYNNLSIVQGERQKNKFINSCSVCGQCGEICPEGLDMGEVCLEARQLMVSQKRMPPSAHDFALRDMAFSNSEAFTLARHQPGSATSQYLFFPGCQLSASSPEYVEKLYTHLRHKTSQQIDGSVGLMLRCCGAPAEWAGRQDLFEQSRADFMADYHRLGQPKLILACSSCYQVFKKHYPDIKITSLWTLLDQIGLPPSTPSASIEKPLAIHDPCATRHESQIQNSIRNILSRLGYQIQELPMNREKTECCSYGGVVWLANPKLAKDIIQRRISENPLDYVTYCAMCRDFYAGQEKPTLHLLDLIFNADKTQELSHRKGPNHSNRHENRARLKKKLLKGLWKEKMEITTPYASIRLNISDAVWEIMQQRLILVEDIQQVIEYAEQTEKRMLNIENGHFLAYYRPSCVTYWVEYSIDEGAYTIHNTYSHRMVIEKDKGAQT